MNKKVLDKEGTAYLVEKIKENFVAKKDLEPINELPETGEPGRIYIIPEKKYINLEMVYANNYQQLIVVHDGSLNPKYLSENVPGAGYTGITNDAVKITVGGLLFSGAQGIGYEGDYEDQHGRTVHGEVYYCDTMESQEFRQIVIENGGTLIGLPVQAEIVEGLFIDDEGGVTPKFTASFNYGEDITNQSPITNNYIQYIYTEDGGWQEIGGNKYEFFKGTESEWDAFTPEQQKNILFAAVLPDEGLVLTPEEEEDLTSSLGVDGDIEVDMSLEDALDTALDIANGN